MKGTIIFVIALFAIAATAKTDEGRNCSGKEGSKHPDSAKNDDGRILILLGNSTGFTKAPSPILVKRKSSCACKLPLCICKNCENPEGWFVKTHLRAGKKVRSARPPVKVKRITVAKEKRIPPPKAVPSLGQSNQLRGKKLIYESRNPKEEFVLQCECMKCKLFSNGKSGVLLKGTCCGPIHMNGTKKENNFSKLVCKLNNRINIRTKFLEINQ